VASSSFSDEFSKEEGYKLKLKIKNVFICLKKIFIIIVSNSNFITTTTLLVEICTF